MGQRDIRISPGIIRIERSCAFEEGARTGNTLRGKSIVFLDTSKHQVVGIGIIRLDLVESALVGRRQGHFERSDDATIDAVLQFKNIRHDAIESFRPEVAAAATIDQLRIDANLVAAAAYTAFQYVAHAEFGGYGAQVDRLAFIGKARVTANHEQSGYSRQVGGQVFGDAVGEVILLAIAAHVVEWQNGD